MDPIEIDLGDFLPKNKVVLALGAELKANYCIAHGQRAYLYSGFDDLKVPECFNRYQTSIITNLKKHKIRPEVIAHDLNPAFLSSGLALKLKETLFKKAATAGIQHHFAHIAGVYAAAGLKNKNAVGIACDGTGWGNDQKVWGCEFIGYDGKNISRYGHLNYMPLAGGDKAVLETWRTAVGLLYLAYGRDLLKLPIPWVKKKQYEIKILIQMIEKKINTPWASSAGRLFDGISALLGVCQQVEHEAQAAVALEQEAAKVNTCPKSVYPYKIKKTNALKVIDTTAMIKAIVKDIDKGRKVREIAACFHNTFAEALTEMTKAVSEDNKAGDIVLGGGVFFNKIILAQLKQSLEKSGMKVHVPGSELLSDSGLSLGQAVLALKSSE